MNDSVSIWIALVSRFSKEITSLPKIEETLETRSSPLLSAYSTSTKPPTEKLSWEETTSTDEIVPEFISLMNAVISEPLSVIFSVFNLVEDSGTSNWVIDLV